jgi:hypothetical protein
MTIDWEGIKDRLNRHGSNFSSVKEMIETINSKHDSILSASEEIGVSHQSLFRKLNEFQIAKRVKGRKGKGKFKEKLRKLTDVESKEMDTNEMAKLLGCSRRHVYYSLKSLKKPFRRIRKEYSSRKQGG